MRGNESISINGSDAIKEGRFQIPMRGNELNGSCRPLRLAATVSNPHEG